MSLQGKVALVTGASRGIGQAIALELARQGATVLGTATSEAGAAAISQYLANAGAQGKGLMLNVTDAAQLDTVLAEIAKEFGDIQILVNNAGITRDQLLMRMKDEDWDAIMDTNLKPVFRLSKAVLRGMMKGRWGRIISIASVVGAMGSAGQANYAAAKAGIMGFTKVNCVAPGFIDTDMTKGLAEEYKQQLLVQIPLGKLGEPQHIADAVAFLASDRAAYLTGQTLHVNGGMYMG